MCREYTDPLLTRAVAGLQRSMVQGKKEMQERKARDRAKAQEAMRKVWLYLMMFGLTDIIRSRARVM